MKKTLLLAGASLMIWQPQMVFAQTGQAAQTARSNETEQADPCALLDCSPQDAQSDAEPDLNGFGNIDNILVIGAPLDNPIGDKAYAITNLGRFALDNEASGRLENALLTIPSLQQFRRSDSRSANPTSQGITLRGLGGNASSRALLTLDGVPQADPFGGWVSFPGFDALAIDNVRVRRGGGTGSAGPGALAGTIDLTTRGISSGSRYDAALAYGSRNSVEGNVEVAQKLGAGGLIFSGQYARGDGFIPIVESQRGSVDRGAEYEQFGFGLRFVAPVNADTEIQTSFRGFVDRRERGFAFSENSNGGVDANVRIVSKGRWQYSALAYVQLREFETSFGAVSADRNNVNQVLDQFDVPSTGLGAHLELRPPVGDNAELRIGGDWRRTIGETNERFFFQDAIPQRGRVAGGQTDTVGGYIEGSWKVSDALLLTGGGRLDYWSISDGLRREFELISPFPGALRSLDEFADRDGTEATGRIGFAYDAASLLTLRGAAYLGWRLPTLNELYRPFRVGADATAANENLNPERVRGVEIGLDWEIATFSFSSTLFYNVLDNAIANVTLDQGPGLFPGVGFVSGAGTFSQRQNLDEIESLGAEFDAVLDIGSFSISASYAYVDAEVAGTAEQIAIDGLRPAQVPRHFATGSLGWYPSGGNSGITTTLRYVGGQFDDDGNTLLLGDAFSVDGRATYALNDNLTVEARVENLFDAEILAGISGGGIIERARPQTFWIGLRIGLGA